MGVWVNNKHSTSFSSKWTFNGPVFEKPSFKEPLENNKSVSKQLVKTNNWWTNKQKIEIKKRKICVCMYMPYFDFQISFKDELHKKSKQTNKQRRLMSHVLAAIRCRVMLLREDNVAGDSKVSLGPLMSRLWDLCAEHCSESSVWPQSLHLKEWASK